MSTHSEIVIRHKKKKTNVKIAFLLCGNFKRLRFMYTGTTKTK